jgi:uncharacterized protein
VASASDFATHGMHPATGSLPVSERIPVLDILRGFALLGILIMNMPGFSSSGFAGADGSHVWPGALDQLAEQLRDALFAGKFNSMFSLLFGIGFTIQFDRLQRADPQRADRIYLRRLLVLLAIGLVHGFVFWNGDVLHVYAALGLLLLVALRRIGDRGILLLIALCLLYPALSGLLRVWIVTPEVTVARLKLAQAFEASNNLAFGSGGLLDAASENSRMMLFFYGDTLALWSTLGFYVMLALTMLIGLLAGRRRWVQRSAELMPRLRAWMWVSVAVGLASSLAFTVIFETHRTPGPSLIKVLGSVCFSLSRLALTVFYVLLIVRLAQEPAWQRRFAPMAAAGRMPLTNYLMQTAICITLFDGWGFGLWMKVGPAAGFALALVIFFGLQVPWSLWWLRRHERGPVEALWARCTYGTKRLPNPSQQRA